jgi:hypothetical protein
MEKEREKNHFCVVLNQRLDTGFGGIASSSQTVGSVS